MNVMSCVCVCVCVFVCVCVLADACISSILTFQANYLYDNRGINKMPLYHSKTYYT
jgi:hypothetical protein